MKKIPTKIPNTDTDSKYRYRPSSSLQWLGTGVRRPIVMLSSRKILVLEYPRRPIYKSVSLSSDIGLENSEIISAALLVLYCLYLTDVLKPAAKNNLRSGLRSSSTNNYILPRLQSRLGERAFSYAGPLSWNSLPTDL